MSDPDPLRTRDEAAERLHVSEATVRRLCKAGHLVRVNVSARMWRITDSSIEAHIASRTETGAANATG